MTGIIIGLKERVEIDRQNMEIMQRLKSDLEVRRNELARRNQPYFTLKRDIEDLRRNNEELNRMIQKEVAEVGQPLNTVIVRDPARPVLRPVSPKTFVIIPFGVLVGLVVGVSLAFFIEYLDTSVKTIDDVERALQAPVLGVIPQNVGNIMEDGGESRMPKLTGCCAPTFCFRARMKAGTPFPSLSGGRGRRQNHHAL